MKITLIQTEFLPYSIAVRKYIKTAQIGLPCVLGMKIWGKSKPAIKWLGKFMFEGFMYQNRVLKWNLTMEFINITILKEKVTMCIFFKKNISLNAFFLKINNLSVELKFYTQTKEEEYKCDSNIAWKIAFKVFWFTNVLF